MAKSKKQSKTETTDEGTEVKVVVDKAKQRRDKVLALVSELEAISGEYQKQSLVSPAGVLRHAVQRVRRLFNSGAQF